MSCLRTICSAVFCSVIAHGATVISEGFSGIVSGFSIFDLEGGAENAVSFYFLGTSVGEIEAFDDLDGLGNSLGTGEIIPRATTPFNDVAYIEFVGKTARSLVFNITGDLRIDNLTYGGIVLPEPGTFMGVSSALLFAWLLSRRNSIAVRRLCRRI